MDVLFFNGKTKYKELFVVNYKTNFGVLFIVRCSYNVKTNKSTNFGSYRNKEKNINFSPKKSYTFLNGIYTKYL